MMNSPAKTDGGQESFDTKQREAIRLPDGCMLVLSGSHLRSITTNGATTTHSSGAALLG
jgi:hypothetical protein